MNLPEILNWRYATKAMNGNKVPAETLERILDAAQMAPSSGGLQPYRIIVISDPELKEKLKAAAYNQQQITQASEVLVFAAWNHISDEQVDQYVKHVAETRSLSMESLKPLKEMFGGRVNRPEEETFAWTARQAYIALGFALVAAANEKVDATPMDGFEPEKVDELLDLGSQGLRSAGIMCIGYRDAANDWLVDLPKVRTPKDQLFIRK